MHTASFLSIIFQLVQLCLVAAPDDSHVKWPQGKAVLDCMRLGLTRQADFMKTAVHATELHHDVEVVVQNVCQNPGLLNRATAGWSD